MRLPIVLLISLLGILRSTSDVLGESDFSLGSDFSLALAKGLSAQAAKNEREGKFRQALEYYDKEVASAALAIREADDNAEVRTAEMLLILGAAHFDSARMEQELQDLGAGEIYRAQLARIDDHLLLGHKALTRALEAERTEFAKNMKVPISQRRIYTRPVWMIEQTLGDVCAFRGETKEARDHYSSALKFKPDSEHARQAIVLLDAAEKKATAVASTTKDAKVANGVRGFASTPAARQTIVQLVRLGFSKAGAGWGIVAGGVTDAVLTMLLEKK